jgi:hypothetical protein
MAHERISLDIRKQVYGKKAISLPQQTMKSRMEAVERKGNA